MENPTKLSASSSGRRSSSASNSPEFEFWMVRNPSCPETTLHSADELFSGGVLLPLQLLNTHIPDEPPDVTATVNVPATESSNPDPVSGPEVEGRSDLSATLTASKRWKDIFKKRPQSKEKEKKKKDRNGGGGGGGGGTSAAELNINLWPFSRSRSAGNGGSRPRTSLSGSRKVSSAPCSRSNSAGESKSRKWPSSPSRNGVHLGRSSPVWQVKRVGSGRNSNDNIVRTSEKGVTKKEIDTRRSKKSTPGVDAAGTVAAGAKAKVLNLNVPTCIGYRHHLGCRSDVVNDSSAVRAVGGNSGGAATQSDGVGTGGDVARGSNLFNLRSLFTKKVY